MPSSDGIIDTVEDVVKGFKWRDLNRTIEGFKAVLERFDRIEGLLKEILEELKKR